MPNHSFSNHHYLLVFNVSPNSLTERLLSAAPISLLSRTSLMTAHQALVSHHDTLTSFMFPNDILIATGNNFLSPHISWPLFSYIFQDPVFGLLLSLASLTHWFLLLLPSPPSTVLSSPSFFYKSLSYPLSHS